MSLAELSKYLSEDKEKKLIIDDILFPAEYQMDDKFMECSSVFLENPFSETKYCPKCFKKYNEKENFCYDCLCSLKHLSDMKKPRDISFNPIFTFKGSNVYNTFDEIFTEDNLLKINDFDFSIVDFEKITQYIKRTALENMDEMAKSNEIIIDDLNIWDKVLMFAKAFVNVDFKSYGVELGHFEFDRITVDDRQTPPLHMTTLIHELSHFLLKEILVGIICRILDCEKNSLIESIALYTLIFSPFTQLIDEYCAHTVEGRFTLYGYQDYSSFLSIEQSLDGEMSREEIDMTKTIGNTFSIAIKDILETFLDDDLRGDIKDQFMKYTFDKPNYEMLRLENCSVLKNQGFIKSIQLIVSEGFHVSASNTEMLIEYEKHF